MDVLIVTPIAIAIITGITQALKGAGMNPLLAPIVEIGLGLIFMMGGVWLGAVTVDIGDLPVKAQLFWAGVYGLIAGLSAAGLYTDKKTATAPNE